MKKTLIFLSLIFIGFLSFAQKVNNDKIRKVATNFFSLNYSKSNSLIFDTISLKKDINFILVKDLNGHFLIMSDNYCGDPIVGYGAEAGDTIPVQLVEILQNYGNYVKYLEKNKSKTNANWTKYETLSKAPIATTVVSPLITVKWDQGSGWNRFCPVDAAGPGGHTYAGCVAVSMAQAMSVFEHPDVGVGSSQYNCPGYGAQYANYDTTHYHWELMSSTSSDNYNSLLLFHCGVSVEMGYGADGSGAYTSDVPGALKSHFDYSSDVKYRSRSSYTTDAWKVMLKAELDAGRPIVYSGNAGDGNAGHAFDLDGYNSSDYFHVNWGWSGSYNDYYSIDALSPGSSDFSKNCAAVIGIAPKDHSPTDIHLSTTTFIDTLNINDTVAKVNVTDPDQNETFTYEISGFSLEGPGYCPFVISNDGYLILTEIVSANQHPYIMITINVEDSQNNTLSKDFTITVKKDNYPPTAINFSKSEIINTVQQGEFICKLSSTDPDANETFVYSLLTDTINQTNYDNAKFYISNDTLYSNSDFSSLLGQTVNIYIRTTDHKGAYYQTKKSFSVVDHYSNINQIDTDNFSIYPNPTYNGFITIKVDNIKELQKIEIYNTLGQKVIDISNFYSENIQTNFENKGVFLIKIYKKENIIQKNIIYQ